MKICIISAFYYPYDTIAGGAFVYTKTLADALKKEGHDVFIITTGRYDGLKSLKPHTRKADGIEVYYFYPLTPSIPYNKKKSLMIFNVVLNFWNPHTYLEVKEILKKEKPDVVNIHEVPYLSLSVYSAVRLLGIPIVSTLHSILLLWPLNNIPHLDKIAGVRYPFISYKLYEKISEVYRKMNKIIIGDTEIVISPSAALLKKYEEYEFFKRPKKIVSPYIIDIHKFKIEKEEKMKKETFDIIFTGRLIKIKGVHTLIKAFRKIEGKFIKLHIFGSGQDEEYFKKLAKDDKRIIFYGSIPNDELQRFYKIADASVVPSEYFENFSVSIMESFRAGVPVIGSNIGGTPELIQNDYNGFLFEPGNVEQLKNILEKAINNKEKLNEMGENAFEYVKELGSEKTISKLEEVYEEAIKLKQRK